MGFGADFLISIGADVQPAIDAFKRARAQLEGELSGIGTGGGAFTPPAIAANPASIGSPNLNVADIGNAVSKTLTTQINELKRAAEQAAADPRFAGKDYQQEIQAAQKSIAAFQERVAGIAQQARLAFADPYAGYRAAYDTSRATGNIFGKALNLENLRTSPDYQAGEALLIEQQFRAQQEKAQAFLQATAERRANIAGGPGTAAYQTEADDATVRAQAALGQKQLKAFDGLIRNTEYLSEEWAHLRELVAQEEEVYKKVVATDRLNVNRKLLADEEYLDLEGQQIASFQKLNAATKARADRELAGVAREGASPAEQAQVGLASRQYVTDTSSSQIASEQVAAQVNARRTQALATDTLYLQNIASARTNEIRIEQERTTRSAEALSVDARYQETKAQGVIAQQRLDESIQLQVNALRTGADVERKAAIAQQEKAAALEQQVLATRAQKNADEATLRAAAEVTLNQREYAARLRRVTQELAASPEFAAQYQGGTLIQRLQAQIRQRDNGLPIDPSTLPTGGQLLGQSALTTARFAASGALLFGGYQLFRTQISQVNEFEASLAQVGTELQSLGQGNQLDPLRQKLLNISAETGQSASGLATVAERFVGAFGSAQKAAEATEAAAKLAAISGDDLNTVAEAIQSATKNFGISGTQLGDIAVQIRNAFGTPIKETLSFFGTIGPVASAFGFSAQQAAIVGGGITAQSPVKSGAAEAEGLNRLLPDFAANSHKLLDFQAQLPNGIKLFDTSDVAAGNYEKVLEGILKNIDLLSPAEQQQLEISVASSRNRQYLISLFRDHVQVYKDLTGQTQLQGSLDQAFSAQQETLKQKTAELSAAFTKFTDELYNGGLGQILKDIVGFFSDAVRYGTDLINILDKLGPFKDLILAGGAIYGIAKVAPILGSIATQVAGTNTVTGGVLRGITGAEAPAASGATFATEVTSASARHAAEVVAAATEFRAIVTTAGAATGEELAAGGVAGGVTKGASGLLVPGELAAGAGAAAIPAESAFAAGWGPLAGGTGAGFGGVLGAGFLSGGGTSLVSGALAAAPYAIAGLIAQAALKHLYSSIPGSIPGTEAGGVGANLGIGDAAKNVFFGAPGLPGPLGSLTGPFTGIPYDIGRAVDSHLPFGLPSFLGGNANQLTRSQKAAIDQSVAGESADQLFTLLAGDTKNQLSPDVVQGLTKTPKFAGSNQTQQTDKEIFKVAGQKLAENRKQALTDLKGSNDVDAETYKEIEKALNSGDDKKIKAEFDKAAARFPTIKDDLTQRNSGIDPKSFADSKAQVTDAIVQTTQQNIQEIEGDFASGDKNLGQSLKAIDEQIASLKDRVKIDPAAQAELDKAIKDRNAWVIQAVQTDVSEIQTQLKQGDISLQKALAEIDAEINSLPKGPAGDKERARLNKLKADDTSSAHLAQYQEQASVIKELGGPDSDKQAANVELKALQDTTLSVQDRKTAFNSYIADENKIFHDYVNSLPTQAAKLAALKKGVTLPKDAQVVIARELAATNVVLGTSLQEYADFTGQTLEAVQGSVAQIAVDQGITLTQAFQKLVTLKENALALEDEALRNQLTELVIMLGAIDPNDHATIDAILSVIDVYSAARAALQKQYADLQAASNAANNAGDTSVPNSVHGSPSDINSAANSKNDKAASDAKAYRDALHALAKARYALNPLKLAEEDQKIADEALNEANLETDPIKRAADVLNAQAQRITADRSYTDAIVGAIEARTKMAQALHSALGNDAAAAQDALQLAKEELFKLAFEGAQGQPLIDAQSAVATAQITANQADLQQKENLIEFNASVHKISTQAELAQLEGIDAYAHVLATQGKLSIQFVQDLDKKIYDLKHQLAGDLAFNLPTDLALPTLYEARRFNESGGHYQDNRTITITLTANTKLDTSSALNSITDALNASPRFGTTTRTY